MRVTFADRGRTVEIERGTSILEAALAHGVNLHHTCGGNASCSTCRVLVLSGAANLSPVESAEARLLDSFDLKPPHRLGCRALVVGGDVEVRIPERERPPRPNKTPQVPR